MTQEPPQIDDKSERRPHAMICLKCMHEEFRPSVGTGKLEICPVCGAEAFRTILTEQMVQYLNFLIGMRIFNQHN